MPSDANFFWLLRLGKNDRVGEFFSFCGTDIPRAQSVRAPPSQLACAYQHPSYICSRRGERTQVPKVALLWDAIVQWDAGTPARWHRCSPGAVARANALSHVPLHGPASPRRHACARCSADRVCDRLRQVSTCALLLVFDILAWSRGRRSAVPPCTEFTWISLTQEHDSGTASHEQHGSVQGLRGGSRCSASVTDQMWPKHSEIENVLF